MSIKELSKELPKLKIEVSVEELSEFAEQILNGARAIYEKPEVEEQYLTRKQVAEMLECSYVTLNRWNKIGYLTALKFGGKVRYKLSDVENIKEKELKK